MHLGKKKTLDLKAWLFNKMFIVPFRTIKLSPIII